MTNPTLSTVRDAYKRCRRFRQYRRTTILSEAGLCDSPLIASTLLAHLPFSAENKTLALQSLLQWATDKLKPQGEPQWMERTWRSYGILHDYYLMGETLPTMLTRLMVSESTFFSSTTAALRDVVRVLADELVEERHQVERQQTVVASLYGQLSAEAQRLLRRLAIYRTPLPMAQARTLLLRDQTTILTQLLACGLLCQAEHDVFTPAEVRPYLHQQLSATEQVQWHRQTAQSYLEQDDILASAYHRYAAGDFETAAQHLLDNQYELMQEQTIERLQAQINAFQASQLTRKTWLAVQIMVGRIARWRDDVETALVALRPVLGAEDTLLRALANYEMGRSLQLRDLDAALHHFEQCIGLLVGDEQVLARHWRATAHVEYAWILIQDRPNLSRAATELAQAEQLITQLGNDAAAALRSDFHNAAGTLSKQLKNGKEYEHLWKAWDYAHVSTSAQRIARTAHNLGTYYWHSGEYALALRHLEESLTVSQNSDNIHLIASNEKHIGACHFQQENYVQAHHHYVQAYNRYVKIGATMWRAYTCYDLAEVLILLHRPQEARHFFDEAFALSQQLELHGFQQGLLALRGQYGELAAETDPRHAQILSFVRENEAITKKECVELTNLKDRQAVRILNELLEQGKLIKVGKGRATQYILA